MTLPKGKELVELAKKLGADTQGEKIYQSSMGRETVADEYELQRRVIEAKRSRRESWLWIFALVSAGASMISALTALFAVLKQALQTYIVDSSKPIRLDVWPSQKLGQPRS